MENSQQGNELADTLKKGMMLVPPIWIPYLFGLTAYKVGSVVFEAADTAIQSISLTPQPTALPKKPPIEHTVSVKALTGKSA